MSLSEAQQKDLEGFVASLPSKSDDDLVEAAAHYCYLSAYAANNPRSVFHPKCDATYSEATRRGKPWLYKRGWNDAYAHAGHRLTAEDIKAGQEPVSA